MKKTYSEAYYTSKQVSAMNKRWKLLSSDEKRSDLINRRTPSECRLEELLRKSGIEYSLQVPFSGFFLDFQIRPYRIAVEVDGGAHNYRDVRSRSATKDKVLTRAGWIVLHFTNGQVKREPSVVLRKIRDACEMCESWKHPAIARTQIRDNTVVVVPKQ